jgi:hypothetical protein
LPTVTARPRRERKRKPGRGRKMDRSRGSQFVQRAASQPAAECRVDRGGEMDCALGIRKLRCKGRIEPSQGLPEMVKSGRGCSRAHEFVLYVPVLF